MVFKILMKILMKKMLKLKKKINWNLELDNILSDFFLKKS
jgi:hypothetical protein